MKFIKSIMEKLIGGNWKLAKMSKETKGILTILIAEVQDCENMEEVKSLSDCWVKANDLHPEKVEQVSREEFEAKYSPKKN